jgi:hypothetical protein
MIQLSPGMLIVLYLIGWASSLYIGMRINDRMWRKRERTRNLRAYHRGWEAGYGFLNKIEDAKTEQISGVTIRAEKASQ